MMPEDENMTGIEVALGRGRFSKALGIKEVSSPQTSNRDLVSGMLEWQSDCKDSSFI
jgi:hypothetical protein